MYLDPIGAVVLVLWLYIYGISGPPPKEEGRQLIAVSIEPCTTPCFLVANKSLPRTKFSDITCLLVYPWWAEYLLIKAGGHTSIVVMLASGIM